MAKIYVDIDKDHAHIRKICRKLDADLNTVNKTAVNIPFGTGKTVVLEQIIYDNMDKNILVFVPTHLVRNKHLDSINQYCRRVYKNGRIVTPKNVTIRCYNSIKKCFDEPWDIIFADEYHHLGGEVWSKQFDALLKDNPKAKVIGTTATHIRSDGKDMTEILFGHISSEMTTSEAIKNGILPSAKFYGATYSLDGLYEDVCEFLEESRIEKDEEIDKLLKKIKKHTENANRLKEFFDETIPAKGGKYVIFCSNIDQMNMVWDKIDEWFAGKKISKYSVYYKNSRRLNEKSIREFETADSSDRLVFMININIVNEGYHFKDLDGVIIYRPTKSIVKYPQQIGRPLTMDWKAYGNIPTIIDLTNSIEDLKFIYNQAGSQRSDLFGKNVYFDNDINFSIYKDDKEILDILNKLHFFEAFVMFDIGFSYAKQYYKEHGNLLVPVSYECDDGFKLGQWIQNRRQFYKNNQLSLERIRMLESIGMIWDYNEYMFMLGFSYAEQYYKEHGNLLVPDSYECGDKFKLGMWIQRRRYEYRRNVLSDERIRMLESIGMIWNPHEYSFSLKFKHAEQYYKEHGDLLVPREYVCDDGFKLGLWIQTALRTRYRRNELSDEQISMLESIGMIWNYLEYMFMFGFKHAEQYYKEHGNLLVPHKYVCDDKFKLGAWISGRRKDYKQNKLSSDRIHMLESIGMIWNPPIGGHRKKKF